jgi:hypothetical protein
MAVDFAAWSKALMKHHSVTWVATSVHKADLFAGLSQHIGTSRYVKRLWRRMGRLDSLRAFARTLAAWDQRARAWLAGRSVAAMRRGEKVANFGILYGMDAGKAAAMGAKAASRPNMQQQPREPIHGQRVDRMIVDDPYARVPGGSRARRPRRRTP